MLRNTKAEAKKFVSYIKNGTH